MHPPTAAFEASRCGPAARASRRYSEMAFATISAAITSGIAVFFCRRPAILDPKAPSSRCASPMQCLVSQGQATASRLSTNLSVAERRYLVSQSGSSCRKARWCSVDTCRATSAPLSSSVKTLSKTNEGGRRHVVSSASGGPAQRSARASTSDLTSHAESLDWSGSAAHTSEHDKKLWMDVSSSWRCS